MSEESETGAARNDDAPRQPAEHDDHDETPERDPDVDEGSELSFPASDPPAHDGAT